MWFVLTCVCLLGYCFVLTKHMNLAIETTPFLVTSSIVMILYCFAYMQLLRMGVVLILGFGLLSFIYTPILLVKDKDFLFKKYLTPGFIFGLFILGLSLLTADAFVVGWDAIAYWGPRAKFMVLNQGLIQADTIISHKSYPPGSALFYYLFSWIKFDESKVMMAHHLLLLVPFLAVFQGSTWKNWRSVITYCIFGVIFAAILLKGLHAPIWPIRTLYMDFLVAIFFGISIIYYRMSDRKAADILRLLPPIFALSLFKPRFFHIIFMITMIVSIDQFLEGLFYIKGQFRNKTLRRRRVIELLLKNKKLILKRVLSVLLIPLAGCVAIYSWEFYTVSIHAHIDFSMSHHLTLKTFINVLTLQHLTPLQLVTIKRFSVTIIGPLFVSLIFIIITYLVCQRQRTTKGKYLIAAENIILLLGSIAYLFGLLLLYLFAFSRYEGPRLAAFFRYINIYYLAWYLVLYNTTFYTLFDRFKSLKKFQRSKTYLVFIIVLTLSGFVFMVSYYEIFKQRRSIQWSQELSSIATATRKYVPSKPSTRVFLVWQNTIGVAFKILSFELLPMNVEWGKAIGPGYLSPHDVWHKDWTPNEFLGQLSKEDYLLLGYTDKRFWHDYGLIFVDEPPKLKPLISYNLCLGKGWDPMDKKPCIMTRQKAYLFKVVVKDNGVTLKNVVDSRSFL